VTDQKCENCQHWEPHYEGAGRGDCEVPLPYWVSLGSPDLQWCAGNDCSAFTPKPHPQTLSIDQILGRADRVRLMLREHLAKHPYEAYPHGVSDGLQKAVDALDGKLP
jgi:hypothetical protein